MILSMSVVAVMVSNLIGAFVAVVRIRVSARTAGDHEVARTRVIQSLGPGSRLVDIEGVGMVVDIGPGTVLEGGSCVDHGLDRARRVQEN